MRTLLTVLSAFGMLLSAFLAITDFMGGRYMWGLVMVGCFFLNYNTFRGNTR